MTTPDGLLLSPEQINTAMRSTGMVVNRVPTTMADDSAHVSDQACLPLANPVETQLYAGWTAFRQEQLKDPGTISAEIGGHIAVADYDHFADQAVVLFPSEREARAFLAASARAWPACGNRQYTFTQADWPDAVWDAGPITDANGTISATETVGPQKDWMWTTCQRALTVANNVAIDVLTCSKSQSDSQSDSAVDIAHQIAANVPG